MEHRAIETTGRQIDGGIIGHLNHLIVFFVILLTHCEGR